ncbi:sodium channel modifier 1 isoform X2 [Tachyglossus aculeatus]|uniref:sodium channel modifier 1 isoform X2 n=1 Tax=Tachyglossus aculeatus TaxID=9261 RepID=UPI0018F69D7B|nr:sodium channel modifier 1 isoform X2 [Tachyglossus aculeatus]
MCSRFACAVCPHRPVSDTLAMLTAHRAGRKHLASLQRFYGKKQRRRGREEQGRPLEGPLPQEESEAQGSPAPLLAQTRLLTQNALRPAVPYSSCCRRRPDRSAGPAARSVRTAPSGPVAPQQVGERPPEPPAVPVEEEEQQQQEEDGGVEEGAAAARAPSPGRRRALDHYLKLRSAGWIPDGCGHWVKDANAEFDSDEEEPPPLPPD